MLMDISNLCLTLNCALSSIALIAGICHNNCSLVQQPSAEAHRTRHKTNIKPHVRCSRVSSSPDALLCIMSDKWWLKAYCLVSAIHWLIFEPHHIPTTGSEDMPELRRQEGILEHAGGIRPSYLSHTLQNLRARQSLNDSKAV